MSLTGLAGAAVTISIGLSGADGRPLSPRAAHLGVCGGSHFPAARDRTNPLGLAIPPGPDPLHGAHFFVDGPRHGSAAAAIETLLGFNPDGFRNSDSWEQLAADLNTGPLKAALNHSRRLSLQVHLLEKIADQPETQKISNYASGGGARGIFNQTRKILCDNLRADHTPGTVPVFTTFLVHPHGIPCSTAEAFRSWGPTFKRLVGGMAAAIGRRPAVILAEINGLGISHCLSRTGLALLESYLTYEMRTLTALPHAVVYLEAGYSDAQGPFWTANALAKSGVRLGRGFFTNDTHFAWSSREIRWANRVSNILFNLTHHAYRAHYIVNSAQNGRGPKLNRHPRKYGVEDLCNPPGRGIGRPTTTDTNPTLDGYSFPLLDAFLWTGVPGLSHDRKCHHGSAPAGAWDFGFSLQLAANANNKLGPGYPSRGY
jgi:glycosyl hydrolase family 6